MAHAGGRPTIYSEDIPQKALDYLASCKDEMFNVGTPENPSFRFKVKLPKIEGLAVYLGVHKDTLYEWKSIYPEFSDAFDKILFTQADKLIDNGLDESYNSTISKLMLSSNHGYSDKSQTDITTKGEKININDPKVLELAKKYEEELKKGL